MLQFVQQYFTSVIAALLIMSIAYFIFWYALGSKLHNKKIQLSKRAGWAQIKEEIVATLFSFIGSTIFMLIIMALKTNGYTKFYVNNGQYSPWITVASVIVMMIVADTWFYWSHRAMHHPRIYKYVHALHHKSLDVNPYTSTSFHMIESLWLTIWILPLAMVMPISMTALGITQVIGTFNNLKSHLGYELFPNFFKKAPFNMLVTATNHSLHHTQYNGNYGLYFRFWDKLCNTELNDTNRVFYEIHDRVDAQIIDNYTYQTILIHDIVKENEDTVSVYCKPTNQQFYNYKAGQYITLQLKLHGKTLTRCFSLSSSPNIDDFLRITIKLKGDVSNYFYNTAKIGNAIKSLLPVGDFILMPNSTNQNHYVFVAGGSGITPLYSMIQQVLKYEPKSTATLLYANKSNERIVFQTQLQQLEKKYSQFTCVNFLSGNSRIGINDLAKYPKAIFYICGPNELKNGITTHLNNLKVDKTKIHTEHFADGYVPYFGLF